MTVRPGVDAGPSLGSGDSPAPGRIHSRPCDCCGTPIYALRCGPCLKQHGYPRPDVVVYARFGGGV